MSLSPCSVPGSKPSFHLEEDEMEIGLGRKRIIFDMINKRAVQQVYMVKLELKELKYMPQHLLSTETFTLQSSFVHRCCQLTR